MGAFFYCFIVMHENYVFPFSSAYNEGFVNSHVLEVYWFILEWQVSRNFAKCKKQFCEINFTKMGAKFRKNVRRQKNQRFWANFGG